MSDPRIEYVLAVGQLERLDQIGCDWLSRRLAAVRERREAS